MSGFLDSSTIRSKLHRPPGAADVIERTSLLDAYPIGERGCATLVAAPAGYGKSTYVCQSLDRSEKRCVWLSLDAADSELRRLLTYIAAAIETQFPSACEELLACREMPGFYPPRKLAQIFAGEIEALNEPLILVLDE
mgnify:CR=1 FL=1